MSDALRRHWAEYLMEAAGLGAFVISACLFASLLEHPASSLRGAVADHAIRRVLMGLAMGLTAVAIIYSPRGVICAKLNHLPGARCIFRCGYAEAPARGETMSSARRRAVAALVGVGFLLALVLAGRVVLAEPPSARLDVGAVDVVAMSVADMDRSVAFYSRVLSFEKVSDVEVAGGDYERLMGVFGLRMRMVRMRLGSELIELVTLSDWRLGFRAGLLARDPDSHAIQLIER